MFTPVTSSSSANQIRSKQPVVCYTCLQSDVATACRMPVSVVVLRCQRHASTARNVKRAINVTDSILETDLFNVFYEYSLSIRLLVI